MTSSQQSQKQRFQLVFRCIGIGPAGGGQFAPARPGQFRPARPGQLAPAKGGQLYRIFHG